MKVFEEHFRAARRHLGIDGQQQPYPAAGGGNAFLQYTAQRAGLTVYHAVEELDGDDITESLNRVFRHVGFPSM
jgi:hypothetical protein